ncbi:hypothetical protein DSO57_1001627 [Entomophthora muscae]|uniref:Uncharacterized protein n=1 Tax=Entomophthora muscae TaxID=34485 RepID=A0ACC2RZV2_9FUNG|nr:hypothetical protein DSO57_1001627 [Entomophthora muscae]
MSDEELQQYLEVFYGLNETTRQNTLACQYSSETLIEVSRGYSDLLVVEQTKDKDNWECELAEAPSGGVFHTDINRCHPSSNGQCVEWADGRYFQLTGFHGFNVNAANWTYMAHLSDDWEVYDTPVYPSIAVSKPNFNGAGEVGHVYIIESISPDGKLCTSHWNAPSPKKLSTYISSHKEGVVYLRHVGANATYLL